MALRGGSPLRGAGGAHGDWVTAWRWSGGVDGDPVSCWQERMMMVVNPLPISAINAAHRSYLLQHVAVKRSVQVQPPSFRN